MKVLFQRPYFARGLGRDGPARCSSTWPGRHGRRGRCWRPWTRGQVGGAGLDVFADEPPPAGSPLLRHPRVIGTPHVGGLTGHMFYRSGELFAGNLRRWAAGEAPRWAVNAPPSLRGLVQAS